MSDAPNPVPAVPAAAAGPAAHRGAVIGGAVWVTAGSMAGNLLAYALTLVAASVLGALRYGDFALLMAVQLILAVPALALQNLTARRIALGSEVGPERRSSRPLVALAAGAAGVALGFVTVVYGLPWTTALAGVVVAPVLIALATEQGIAQGGSSFRRLGAILAVAGVGKAVPAVVVMLAVQSVAGALAASAAGTLGAWAVARWRNRRAEGDGGTAGLGPAVGAMRLRQVLHATAAQAIVILLTSLDIILARVVLTDVDAGVYALGAVATKVAFWFPAAVAVIAVPYIAQESSRAAAMARSLGVLAGLGALAVAAAAAAAPLAPLLGAEYRPVVPVVWIFALTGALHGITQGALVGLIAQAQERAARFTALWIPLEAVVFLGGLGWWHGGAVSVRTAALVTAAVAAGAAVTAATAALRSARAVAV